MYIIGKKLNMTQMWGKEDKVAPVTVVKCETNTVVSLKEEEKDGYKAFVFSDGSTTKEFPYYEDDKLTKGSKVTVESFNVDDKIKVSAISKGKGFQGVVKRHNFSGGPASHGHRHDLRQAGSIGSAFPQHVMKGKKMAGRMGADKVSVKNLKIIKINKDENTFMIKGAIPGRRGTKVLIYKLNK